MTGVRIAATPTVASLDDLLRAEVEVLVDEPADDLVIDGAGRECLDVE